MYYFTVLSVDPWNRSLVLYSHLWWLFMLLISIFGVCFHWDLNARLRAWLRRLVYINGQSCFLHPFSDISKFKDSYNGDFWALGWYDLGCLFTEQSAQFLWLSHESKEGLLKRNLMLGWCSIYMAHLSNCNLLSLYIMLFMIFAVKNGDHGEPEWVIGLHV